MLKVLCVDVCVIQARRLAYICNAVHGHKVRVGSYRAEPVKNPQFTRSFKEEEE